MQLKEWLRISFQNLFAMFIPDEVKEELPDDNDLLSKVEYLFRGFDTTVLSKYRQSYGIGVNVLSHYRNVDTYGTKLIDFANVIKHNGSPTPDMCQYNLQLIRFNTFTLTNEEQYQPIDEAFDQLRNCTLILCKTVREAAEKQPDLASYTLRLITPILKNLIDILSVTKEISTRD